MLNERLHRRPEFEEGTPVPMADGQLWFLPELPPSGTDPVHDGIISAVLESEDESELKKSELALTIHLLAKNYELSPPQLGRILSFRGDSKRLAACQSAIHDMIFKRAHSVVHRPEKTLNPPTRRHTTALPSHAFMAHCAGRLRSMLSIW